MQFKSRSAFMVGLIAVLVMGLTTGAHAAPTRPQPATGNVNQPTMVTRSDNYPLRMNSQGDNVRKLQRQLMWLGFDIDWKEQLTARVDESTAKALQEVATKYFWDPQSRVDGSRARRIRLLAGAIDKLPAACMDSGIHICADKTQKLIRWVEDGKIMLTTHVRFGVSDGAHDTPEGSFSVYYKWRDAVSHINCEPVAYTGCMASMPFALFFNGDIAVHFSPTFNAYGYYPGGGSHGCVNVRSEEDSIWMFDHTPEGTPVLVYSS
ncbi:unannotated protein [freshwater metagenome]|uniref:Unannotated protein n=1 Tax=freshwater metagenome TaxID=449393 RepID=A0A6J7IWB1_9ZZZZ|nr:L,D-transpeptidase family protein [Actinomycetota bacterium]